MVAHSMSLIAVQAGVGAHVIRTDPDAAERALEVIAETSRRRWSRPARCSGCCATGRRRRRRPAGPGGSATWRRLVEDVARARGLDVDLTVTGRARSSTAGVELTAYRIVQESLTNVDQALGGRPTAAVTVAYTASGLDIEVVDDAAAPRGPAGTVAARRVTDWSGSGSATRLLGGTPRVRPAAGRLPRRRLPAPSCRTGGAA